MPKENKTQYSILGILTIKPMSGYDIRKTMSESTQYFWSESNGQLYPALARLTDEQSIRAREEAVGDKPRVVYEITKKGERNLQEWLERDVNYSPPRKELILKIFFGEQVDPSVTIDHIEKHKLLCESRLKLLYGIEERLEKAVIEKERPIYYLITLKAGLHALEAEIKWCDESIELIYEYKNIKV